MSRRGHNEGTICQRADGRWCAALSLRPGPDGKRRRKYIYGKTRKEVAEAMKRLQRDQQLGIPIAPERQTFEHYLERWLKESVKPTVRASTFESYTGLVNVHIIPARIGQLQLIDITPEHLQEFYSYKLGQGLSNRTVQYLHAVIRRALGQAMKFGYVPRNVAALVDPPRVARHEVTPMSPDQARDFLKSLEGDRLQALYSVALALGLRRGEALALHWSDVDLDKALLTVRGTLQRRGLKDSKLVISEPKTPQSRRTVALPTTAVRALRQHRVRQKEDQLLAGSRWQDTGLVFTSSIGTPLEPSNLFRHFKEALAAAKLPPMRFHDLRHTCASLLLAQGVHPRVVMEVLGHSQISMTMDIYSHVMLTVQQEAAAKMDAALGG